jgi:hypothetical protein
MAMNDELEPLVSLYRKVAQERTSSAIDARVLAAAEHHAARRSMLLPVSFAAALALMFVLAVAAMTHRQASTHPFAKASAIDAQRPDPTTHYLLHMDLSTAGSPVAQYLAADTNASH